MSQINRVIILGNLVADPKLITPEDNEKLKNNLVSFSIGHNIRTKDKSGDFSEKAHFFDVTGYGNTADYIHRSFHKGSLMLVDGRLDYSSWETEEGQKRSAVSIIVTNAVKVEWPKTVGQM